MDILLQHYPTIVAGLALSLVSRAVYLRHFHPLSNVPGPSLASITTGWLAHKYWRQKWHRYSIQLHKQYGPVVRVGPNAVDVGDVNAVRVIYGTGSKFWKGNWYKPLSAGNPQELLIGVTDVARHKRLRRMLDPLYTLKALRESEGLFDNPIVCFVEQMKAKKNEVVDLAEYMVAFAIDAFTAMAYGERYGLLEQGCSPEMESFVDGNWNPYTWVVTLSVSLGRIEKLYQVGKIITFVILSGGKPPLPILGWVDEKIKKVFASEELSSSAPCLLERSAKLHKDNPDEFPRINIDSHMQEVVFAGFETCGATLPKIIHYIAANNGHQERLRKELEAVKNSGGLPGLVTYDELCQLPFLSACIHEAFRISPITGVSLSRTVPAGGVQMNGFEIPGGTEIGITPWVTSYDEQLMPQPEKYRPERWLEATKDERMLMERSDLFFGAGPAGCVGKVMALGLLYKTVAVVFANFRVECVDSEKDVVGVAFFPVKWKNARIRLIPI